MTMPGAFRAALILAVEPDEPRGNFRVFVDKSDGTVFLADYQV